MCREKSPEHIYYSGPGKTKTDLDEIFDNCILIADSFHELELINWIAEERDISKEVGIRINPDFALNDSPGKFGIDEELCTKDAFTAYPSLVIIGVHVHVQFQELDWEKSAATTKTSSVLPSVCSRTALHRKRCLADHLGHICDGN